MHVGGRRVREFRESDGEENHLYVEELFTRVHQRPMVQRLLPLHFARGLLEESRGSPVNWAGFAMVRCFSPLKRSPFQPHPDYADAREPVPWVHPKVLPEPGTTGSGSESTEAGEVNHTPFLFARVQLLWWKSPQILRPLYRWLK